MVAILVFLSALLTSRFAVAGCDADCDARFNVKLTVTVPASAVFAGEIDPNMPRERLPQPSELGSFDFWIIKSALDADYGDGVSCKNKPAVNVGILYRDMEVADSYYRKLQQDVHAGKSIKLHLVGDNKYLSFHNGKPLIPYCSLFVKAFG